MVVVILGQSGDMNQPLNVEFVEHHKQTKTGYRTHHTGVLFANPIDQIFTFQPVDHIAGRLIGTAFGNRKVGPGLVQSRQLVGVDIGFRELGCTLDANHIGDLFIAANQAANSAVHQQIGVAANRRGEMGVGIKGKTKVAEVFRLIDRLTHRAQHHRLNHRGVVAMFNRSQHALIVLWLWVIATTKADT